MDAAPAPRRAHAADHRLDRAEQCGVAALDALPLPDRGGAVEMVSGIYPMAETFATFGWHTQKVNGHDLRALEQAVRAALAVKDRPSLIECDTVKGKGIPYMEGDNAWHKRVPTAAEVAAAESAIGGDCL